MTLQNAFLDDIVEDVKTTIQNEFTDFGFGTDGSAEDSTDQSMGNEVLRKDRIEVSTSGSSVTVSGSLSSTEMNGQTLREIAVLDADSGGQMKTRDVIDDIQKTSDFEVWVDETIEVNVS